MTIECEQTVDLIQWSVSIGAPIIAGFVGVYFGSRLTNAQVKETNANAFVEKQLSQFYSPMLGLRKEIIMRSELRSKIQSVADQAWKELCEKDKGSSEALKKLSEKRYPEFGKIIDYDNRALTEQLIPAYKEMITLFRENMWLAEVETTKYFQILLEFIDIWDRWIDKSLPLEVWKKLEHSEDKLTPFYDHIESVHQSLISKLKSG